MARLEKELIDRRLLTQEELDRALALAGTSRRKLPTVLVDEGLLDEAALLRIQSEQYGLEFVRLSELEIDPAAVRTVAPKLASHYRIVPVSLDGSVLTIAVSDPLDMAAAEDIETNLGYQVERVLACRADIEQALRRHYGVGAETVERILAETPDREAMVVVEESHDLEKLAEDASVVRLVNQLLQEAIGERATDIHLEVGREGVVVRRRIDGVLYDASTPRNMRLLYPAMISRIKLMSGLDIVERRQPQDGRARVRVGRREYDLRISIVPAIHGEDVVIRILPATMLFDLNNLGFSDRHLELLRGFIGQPHGIIFVTGPTGSGKSTTLYACLSRLNTRDRKIITIEDPVEYELRGITQTQINTRIGLTFARMLRSMLRHDPDVMLVGEVRDAETAEIAIQTAMTGHLVLSSLHTNDAAGAAARLVDMGIDPYLITSTVLVFIAQRLVRTICPECKRSLVKGGETFYRGEGCKSCNQTGYRGRIAICEFLPLTAEIEAMIVAKASAKEIRQRADKLGMKTLAQDGWEKVRSGVTTAEELLRVTSM